MRRTKIICTIGPVTDSEEKLLELAKNGMSIVRFNMSHGSTAERVPIFKRIEKVNKQLETPISVLIDTRGPEIRTSAHTEFGLEIGDTFKIYTCKENDVDKSEKHTVVDYEDLNNMVKKGDTILIDDGLIAVKVTQKTKKYISCKVLNKGKLGRRKSVNLPGIKVDLPPLSSKDKKDIKEALAYKVDFIAQSFVRNKKDVQTTRKLLKANKSEAAIIAKIENQEGVDNIDEILQEADAVMIARGDLGVEIPFEKIPIIQKNIVDKCIKAGKPVIIATQILESMIENPRPTRAEITDVANAVIEKADAIMLSGETTKGAYPVECVHTMDRIASNVQKHLSFEVPKTMKTDNVKEAITTAAHLNAEYLDARAIVIFSKTGRLVSLVARNRPNRDLFVFTGDKKVQRKLALFWSTVTFKINFNQHMEMMVHDALSILKKSKRIKKGDRIIIVSDITPKSNIDVLEVREIVQST